MARLPRCVREPPAHAAIGRGSRRGIFRPVHAAVERELYGGNAVLEIVHPSKKTNGTPHEIGRFDRYFEDLDWACDTFGRGFLSSIVKLWQDSYRALRRRALLLRRVAVFRLLGMRVWVAISSIVGAILSLSPLKARRANERRSWCKCPAHKCVWLRRTTPNRC